MLSNRWVFAVACLFFVACSDTSVFNPLPDATVTADSSPFRNDLFVGDISVSQPKRMFAHSAEMLFAIEPSTLSLTQVGSFGIADAINDLAVTPTGELYGLTKTALFRVSSDSGAATLVTQVPGAESLVAMTFERGGALLAADKAGTLSRIDIQSGQVTTIGSYGSGLGESGDLVAIKDGTLYGVNDVGDGKRDNNDLTRIDPSTGKATIIGPIGFARVWGLGFWRGVIYGWTKGGEMLSIDPATGKGTLINRYPHEFWGAAVNPIAPIE